MARDRNGSYAELVAVPATNVIPVRTTLGWPELAALPESYATAWTALHANLALTAGDALLVRGGMSSLGQAAINLAAQLGATVTATTRRPERAPLLRELGADDVLIDDGALAPRAFDAVLDLVGNRTLRDSLGCAAPRGRVCQLGFLGGLDPVEAFNPLADVPSGVQLSIFASAFVLGEPAFPLSAVPFEQLAAGAERGDYRAAPRAVFGFDEIVAAHRALEANETPGKLVVSLV
jgi:NADPH:quinone reductase-like Zn-dependent oxidoreductase